jgi:predicted RNase H-like HicB family nuclease
LRSEAAERLTRIAISSSRWKAGALTAWSWKPKRRGFTVIVPSLPSLVTYGATKEEALDNAAEAIRLYIASLNARGLPVPQDTSIIEEIAVTA